jgi:hypothetical protein
MGREEEVGLSVYHWILTRCRHMFLTRGALSPLYGAARNGGVSQRGVDQRQCSMLVADHTCTLWCLSPAPFLNHSHTH